MTSTLVQPNVILSPRPALQIHRGNSIVCNCSLTMAEDFSLFTTMRYDPRLKQIPGEGAKTAGWNFENESPLYMLDFHRDRILRAATHWEWKPAIEALTGDKGLASISQKAVDLVGPSQSPLRLRIVVDRGGETMCEKYNTPEVPLQNLFPERLPPPGVFSQSDPQNYAQFTVLVDDTGLARSEFTHFKTTKRAMYDAARQRAGIAPTDQKEVLVVNKEDGLVMEGTITTPYFWRDGRWVTPAVSSRFSEEEGSGGQDGVSRRWALER